MGTGESPLRAREKEQASAVQRELLIQYVYMYFVTFYEDDLLIFFERSSNIVSLRMLREPISNFLKSPKQSLRRTQRY
jgi:hypothetical protein